MNSTTDTINLFPALPTQTFLNFTLCFFCHLPVAQLHLSLLCPTTSQLYSFSLSLSLSLSLSIFLIYINKRESHKHRVTESQSQKAKKPKKTIGSSTKSIHNHQHQFSSSLISKNTNIKHHKSTRPHNTSTVSTFYESQILRSQSHKHFIKF